MAQVLYVMAGKKMNIPDQALAELSGQIIAIDKKVDRRTNSINRSINTFKKEVTDKLGPLHDFMVGQKAISDQKSRSAGITPDLIKIILWLITIIAGLVGISKLPS